MFRPGGGAAAGDDAWDQKEMPFTEHLRELRNRLAIALGAVGVLAAVIFPFAGRAITFLAHAYFPHVTLNAFGPADVILTEFKFSIYGAIVLGLPILLYQAWMFCVPAINPRTRRMVYGYVAPSLLLALLGLAFAHVLVLPRVATALLFITGQVAHETFGIESTLNLILLLLLAFALVFQTPVVMVLLARLGLVDVATLRRIRRYAAFGMLAAGGILAPDASPTTMLMLAVPMYVLYEISIVVITVMERSWRRERERIPA